MSAGTCHYCKVDFPTPGDLRAYGPRGALVCYDCAMATPERKAATEAAMGATMDAAAATGQGMLLSVEDGFIPLTPGSLNREMRRAKAKS